MRIKSEVLAFVVALAVLFSAGAATAEESQPTSEGAASMPTAEPQKTNELIIRLGNESNPADGVFGPATYGLRGSHKFQNDFSIEAGLVRLHEPNTPTFTSVLDEAQLTIGLPDYGAYAIDVTAWDNRMIGMYTHLIGVELTHKGDLSLTFGAYGGTATFEVESGTFQGVQLGVSAPVGPAELSAACLIGKIDTGSYRKCGIEGAMDFRESSSVPLTTTFGIEERYFDFGNGGSVSDPIDEYIYIVGLEIHLENILF